MHVWAIANQKGGVGKTTTVVNLAALLGESGKRVLIVDMDPQGSLTSYFKLNPDAIEHSVYDLFMHQGKVPDNLPGQLLQDTGMPGVELMPATSALATLERNISQQGGMGLVLSRALTQLWDDFDYVVIDTPPLLGVLLVNAIAAAQVLVLPVQTEFMALKGLERMMHTLKMVAGSRHKPLQYLIVPTMFDRRTQASHKALRVLRQQYEEDLWVSAIPVDTRLRDASREGVGINQFDSASRGCEAYRALLKSLLQMQPVKA
ncbi:ParA family protein [Natronospirillum operosum]|uniref:ParA family protein n=1 Tax=Natronospirillum operosum TaxID=2759953 RepID=A0A4Z0WDP6_9GAMM|nr:ParA family protein [Natronospirillum operosum]TGG95954.1 ParA family protein [Natronospirillum operosum]